MQRSSNFLRLITWIIFIAILVGTYFLFLRPAPCSSPIEYKIGTFDTRFGISQTDFLKAVSSAEAIWEKPMDKNLFEYNPNGSLTINLIYDTRQKNTMEAQVLKADVDKTNSLAQSLKNQYTLLQTQYTTSSADYKSMLAQLETDQATYNAEVEYWNNQGGAPRDEYQKLTEMKNNLITEQNTVETKRLEVNSLADQINAFINKYNLLVDSANAKIDSINSTVGEEFEEGLYDPNTNTIDIYQFTDNAKLVRVLAHELGHAIGLDHNTNPQSIMYAMNQANTLKLTADDLSAIKTLCKLQS